ncbi:unnamed protein product [Bemisia tabaci]|uniref:PHD-type domain-containing protein n=1 Tax=Bemisia tabaci TaxID=7038 RepID=A0A9P0F502_BEMTA|nr:PREDICTED: metal-response element-binding transcription factor 2 [Bemisia tabaci]CAH0388322.1 unnamed protein product [Bemisia tabaci]
MSAPLKKALVNGESAGDAPDSTTKERVMFNPGEEVLVNHMNRFIFGYVVQADLPGEKCLVKYDDGNEKWCSFKYVRRLIPESTVKCVVCKESSNKTENQVIVCDKCLRGYHKLCHQPNVTGSTNGWLCKHCDEKKSWPKKTDIVDAQPPKPPKLPPLPTSVRELPYKLDSLLWDTQHQTNSTGQYCYCGGAGDWFLKMLQCGRCKQWFHERCVRALTCPLFIGDRFFIFVCGACHRGVEILRRIEMTWSDLVHLALFNLTAYECRKYHDLDNLMKFLLSNWSSLQLPPKMFSSSREEIRENVTNVLHSDKKRFKDGVKLKKPNSWGLCERIPPPGPVFTLLPHLPISTYMPISDVTLAVWLKDKELKFYPLLTTLDPKSMKQHGFPPAAGIKLIHKNKRPLVLPKGVPATGHKVCIKSSVPCYPEPAKLEKRIREQELASLRLREYRVRKSRKPTKSSDTEDASLEHITPPTPPPSEDTPQPTPPSNSPAPGATPSCGSAPMSISSQTSDCDSASASNGQADKVRPITLPLPLTPVITQSVQRPLKRKLCEKDIRINRNGEVKRRRVRRQCTLSPVKQPVSVSQLSIPNSKTSSSLTATPVPHVHPCSSTSVANTSNCQTISPMSLHDLKSSVHSYFGAASRISCGEKFIVRAKRTLADGRTQYLIQWNNRPLT